MSVCGCVGALVGQAGQARPRFSPAVAAAPPGQGLPTKGQRTPISSTRPCTRRALLRSVLS